MILSEPRIERDGLSDGNQLDLVGCLDPVVKGAIPLYRSANVTLFVADFDRSVRFYVEALGLTLRGRYGSSWAEVEAPGLSIGIHPTRAAGPTSIRAEGFAIGLQVEALDDVVARLAERGVKFSDRREDTGARFADFVDPDGLPLYLIELKGHT
jgi:catechol 2,3-dioxygenase-like lactoylglutathione lyase family enzyme